MKWCGWLAAGALIAALVAPAAAQTAAGSTMHIEQLEPALWDEALAERLPHDPQERYVWAFDSRHFGDYVVVLPGVFTPTEAESDVLPVMDENREIFRDAAVLDIGTGSGVIGLYAARLGARKVVATDISPAAVETARLNARRFGMQDVVEVRLVPESDMRAYSVIEPDETFDVIISNPPYSLNLALVRNTNSEDRGDLGFSILHGLERHLEPDGVALLLYGSLFYHEVMVKYARALGFIVRDHPTAILVPSEAEALFNHYAGRLLDREDVAPGTIGFDWQRDEPLRQIRMLAPDEVDPLLPDGPVGGLWHPGWIAVFRPGDNRFEVAPTESGADAGDRSQTDDPVEVDESEFVVSGRVTDAAGQPMEGVTIRAASVQDR